MEKVKLKVSYVDNITEIVSKCQHRTLAIWAADCAEHVLGYFEEKYPKERRPRNAIEAARAWVRGGLKMTEARKAAFASHAAAREACDEAAIAAARACGHAAATAHVATHAPHAAAYGVKAVGYAKKDINEELAWQYNHLVELKNCQEALK